MAVKLVRFTTETDTEVFVNPEKVTAMWLARYAMTGKTVVWEDITEIQLEGGKCVQVKGTLMQTYVALTGGGD